MTQSMSFLPEAERDIEDVCSWYERRSEGLGRAFLQSVQNVLDTIELYPRMYPVARDEVRRAEVARFPYGIVYIIEGDDILVIGVFHNSREPNQWLSRL
jgi:plasmid stabilization system protein ParE